MYGHHSLQSRLPGPAFIYFTWRGLCLRTSVIYWRNLRCSCSLSPVVRPPAFLLPGRFFSRCCVAPIPHLGSYFCNYNVIESHRSGQTYENKIQEALKCSLTQSNYRLSPLLSSPPSLPPCGLPSGLWLASAQVWPLLFTSDTMAANKLSSQHKPALWLLGQTPAS